MVDDMDEVVLRAKAKAEIDAEDEAEYERRINEKMENKRHRLGMAAQAVSQFPAMQRAKAARLA